MSTNCHNERVEKDTRMGGSSGYNCISLVWSWSLTVNYLLARLGQVRRAGRQSGRATFLLRLLLDVTLGLVSSQVISFYVLSSSSSGPLAVRRALDLVEGQGVAGLRRLLRWLQGAPAGLKLNSVLSRALGQFFLYHIHLWLTFLHLCAPYAAHLAAALGPITPYLGLSLQLSLARDALHLCTFHVRCFYAYARRLFLSQGCGLLSLWRLFRGKKYNPLRQRVDSASPAASQNVDQLLVGTLAFTVMLFLFPTTLVYFVVFKALEMALAGVHAVLAGLVARVSGLDKLALPGPDLLAI